MSSPARSFNNPYSPITFDVDGEEFTSRAAVPAGQLIALADVDRGQATEQFFRTVLEPESAERFLARLNDNERPITTQVLNDVIEWLQGELAGRPNELPGGSPAG